MKLSKNDRVTITRGNEKIGECTWNVSLSPVISCAAGVPCTKDCYAVKFAKLRPSCREAWSKNLRIAREDMPGYFKQISERLRNARKQPRFFRWHVAGDILNAEYLSGMLAIAREFPAIKFLCFTKKFDLLNGIAGEPNLQFVLSMWPGMAVPEGLESYPRSWMQDGTEARIPENAIECPGRCDQCGMCWNLSKIGRDVYFHKH